MASFLLLVATMVIVAEASSSARFLPVPAFHNLIESKLVGNKRTFMALSSLQEQQRTTMLSVRGGAKDEEDDEEEDDDDVESEETEDDEEEEEDETEDESSDDVDYYDDETEEEEEDTLTSQLKKKSTSVDSKNEKASEDFVEPYFVSPSIQMYVTFGSILLSRKIDMFNPKVVRLARYVQDLFCKRDHVLCTNDATIIKKINICLSSDIL